MGVYWFVGFTGGFGVLAGHRFSVLGAGGVVAAVWQRCAVRGAQFDAAIVLAFVAFLSEVFGDIVGGRRRCSAAFDQCPAASL